MKVISPTQGQTRPSARSMGYLEAAVPDLSPIARGLSSLGASIEARAEKDQAAKDKLKNYKSIIAFNDFQTGADELQLSLKKGTDPSQDNYMETFESEYTNYENKFIDGLDPEFQDEYRMRASQVRQSQLAEARKFQDTQRGTYYRQGVDTAADKAKATVGANTEHLQVSKDNIDAQIDAMDPEVISDLEKAELKKQNAKTLESIAYGKELEKKKIGTKQYTNEMAQGINDLAQDLGVNPIDLATVISFESAGTFSTAIRGGKNNKHIGLIQFGEKEQQQYGAAQGQSPREQLQAVKAYLVDRGFKPGMGILDLYSIINAGSPGKYNASDAAHGGTPGSVLDKVNTQMGGHRQNAIKLLGGSFDIPDGLDSDPRFNNVPYEDRIALRKTADSNASQVMAAIEADRKAQQAGMANETLVGIMDGVYGRERVDELRDLGVVTDYDQIKKMYAAIDDRDKKALELEETQNKLAGKIPWDLTDEEDKKRANTWFGKSGNDKLIGGDPEYFEKTLMPFVQSTHMIPPDAIGLLDGMSRGTNAKQALYALNALQMLKNTEPDAYRAQTTDRVKDNVAMWDEFKNVKDQKELLDLIGGRTTEEVRRGRTELLKEVNELMTNKATSDQFGIGNMLDKVDDSILTNPVLPGIASARLGMQRERAALIKENYVKTNGNVEASVRLADEQLLRTWGTTNFNGGNGPPVLMKYPPEKAGYPKIMGDHKWIEDQARAELHIMPDTNMQLISDDRTQADIAAGKPASYIVATEKDGVWQIETQNGKPFRQYFKVTSQLQADEVADVQLKQQEDVAKQKFLRLTEAAAMEQATGGAVKVPQEVIDDYKETKQLVDNAHNELAKKNAVQGPEFIPGGRDELRGRGPKPPIVGEFTVRKGYPDKTPGMLQPGNAEIPSVKDAYIYKSPEDEGFVLLPVVDPLGRKLSLEHSISLFNMTGNHLGMFKDDAAANDYLKKLKGE